MTRKHLRGVLFGRQGCGKGTQGQLLSERFDVPLCAAGDLLRAEIGEKTALGGVIKEYVERGMLAPDELVGAIINKRLKEIDLDKGFLLDGHPRNVEQAESLDRLVKINLALHIKISEKEALRRLLGREYCPGCRAVYHVKFSPSSLSGKCALCGHALARREDDNEEAIRRRMTIFHFLTQPLAGFYRRRGVLLEVNGEQPIPFLFEEIVKKLGRLGFVG